MPQQLKFHLRGVMLKKIESTDASWGSRVNSVHFSTSTSTRSRQPFAEISNEKLEDFLITSDSQAYAPHSTFYQGGKKGDSIFTIRSGLVKLVQYLPNGGQRIVRLLRAGDIAGLELTVGNTYKHTAIALHETHACRIPKSAIAHLSTDHPRLCHQIMVRWEKNVDDADRTITQFSTGPADVRVARLLMHLSMPGEEGRCMAIGREDMGSILGVTTETASRVMADFKRRGVVLDTSNQHTCHFNQSELRKIADT